jgi:hypothetical protein
MRNAATLGSIALALVLGACGETPPPQDDPDAAPPGPDAPPPPAVESVDCLGPIALDVVTAGQSYAPMMAMVAAGDVVRFVMTGEHSVRSDDDLFLVDFGQTGCVRFNTPGTYPYYCQAHGFTGSVVVE